MDCRPSDLVYIMSTPTTYYQLPVLLVKTTRYSRNHKNLNFDAKIGALQVGKNQIIIYYLSVNYIKWFQQKINNFGIFFKFRVLSVRPLLTHIPKKKVNTFGPHL